MQSGSENPKNASHRKIRRRPGNRLKDWEIAIIKAMLRRGSFDLQEIQAYFSRPGRAVNHREFGEIRNSERGKAVKPAPEEKLNDFLNFWPNLDPDTGIPRPDEGFPSRMDDELLIKSREAMIAAVHIFNGAGLTFRSELFIVTSVIAWTYLMHAWYKREGIKYEYSEKLKYGGNKLWDLEKCLRENDFPLSDGVKEIFAFYWKFGTRSNIVAQGESTMRSGENCKLAASISTIR